MCWFDEMYVLVGIVKDLILNLWFCVGGFIYVYRIVEFIDGGYKLEFVYKVSICFLVFFLYCFDFFNFIN